MPTQTSIPYTIKRLKRTKHVRIHVDARGRVTVTAPMRCAVAFIDKFVYDKEAWIVEHQSHIEKQQEKWIVPDHIQQDSLVACNAQAKKFIRDRLRHYNIHYRLSYNKITIKEMTSRWGSCSSQGNLNFHYRLMFLPIELADYVVVHELCHLKHMNHSERFWRLVAEQVPDWKKRRALLNRYPI